MPKNTSKRPYYSKALRAELETMRVVWLPTPGSISPCGNSMPWSNSSAPLSSP